MRKLSEIKGDEAFEVIADMLEPMSVIFTDEDFVKATTRLQKVAISLKNHPKELISILAILDGKDSEEYAQNVNLATLPKAIMDLLSDEELSILF